MSTTTLTALSDRHASLLTPDGDKRPVHANQVAHPHHPTKWGTGAGAN